MPVGCTRCGASEDGEIITPPIAFAFKHNPGCGHGVGPLAVIKGQVKKLQPPKESPKPAEVAKEVVKEVKSEKPKVEKKDTEGKKD